MFDLTLGNSPLLLSVPHAGTDVPAEILESFSPTATQLPDTDWFVDQLYAWAPALGCTMIIARESRYVIDVNRPPNDEPLYAGATTGLVPRVLFDGSFIYQDGFVVDAAEVQRRRQRYFEPYHAELEQQLARIKSQHGHAVIFDAHSILSRVPRLFEGQLPDLNLGTFDGHSAHPYVINLAKTCLAAARDYTHVIDGRFKGGYITRRYGKPHENIHGLQLELSQCTYMDEDAVEYSEPLAEQLQTTLLQPLVRALIEWRPCR